MNQFLKRTLQGDKIVWVVFGLLYIISIVEMFSASSSLVFRSGSIQGPILRHVMFLVAGFVCALIVQLIDFKYIRLLGYVGLVLSLLLLIYTLLFGEEQQGASRFLSVGGFQFQPSEIAKLSLLIVLADQIERCQNIEYQTKAFWWMILGIFVVCLLIFLENLSTAAILFIVSFIMMWIGEINWKKLFGIGAAMVGAVLLILFIAWKVPDNNISLLHRASTWVARIENFVEPEENKFYIDDSNLQIVHAQIAVARGGLFPNGPGTSIERNYLPEAFSDFIFAIIVEEGGFIIGIIVIMLYLILLYRAGVVARQSDSLFCAILVIGVTLMIVIQAFIHVGVSVNFGPVTGQPLPLISRGGTSILVNSVYFGIIISVTKAIQTYKRKKENLDSKPITEDQEEVIEQTGTEETIEIVE